MTELPLFNAVQFMEIVREKSMAFVGDSLARKPNGIITMPLSYSNDDTDTNSHSYTSLMNLHLDKADDAWAAQIEDFDYMIISTR
ncbi:PC-Esterase [Dillenia turbinata]|uniref:PC-Esterase n=1 Tax=Dillenia turbinata TaxID=194707 RepID=A0AAN8Z7S2_9MAGN